MTDKKIVFIDIDGTLFDNERDVVHESTLQAIKALKDNGVYVCIASGRSSIMADQVLRKYQLEFDGYVMINGQFVLLNDEVIYKNPLSDRFIKGFVEECHRLQLPYGFITERGYMVSSHHESVVKAFADFKIDLPKIQDEQDYKQDIYQGLFFSMDYFDHFATKFCDEVKFIAWIGDGADIIPVESSKAIGIEKICKALGVNPEQVYAIGDSTNDIEMVTMAGVGIAMGNAKESLKQVADYVTDPIDEDGLYNALKHFKLI
jgi:Cof subfamily protein (haloacid dehalogenase superfamily)